MHTVIAVVLDQSIINHVILKIISSFAVLLVETFLVQLALLRLLYAPAL